MNRRGIYLASLGFMLLLSVGLAACSSGASQPSAQPSPTQPPTSSAINTPGTEATSIPLPTPTEAPVEISSGRTGDEELAPEITGIASWINSEPFTLESQRGNVVLVDFWTYTCVNCIRTMPFLRSWHEKYADQGLVILGVHTPEFEFEKDRENVIDAAKEFGLEYPIVQDNDFGTWQAFKNRFWPAKYLIDKDGYIRYTHFGEGDYDETELWIRDMLTEAGADLSAISGDTEPEPEVDSRARAASDPSMSLTRELYAGYERNYGALITRSAPPYILQREYFNQQDVEILYSDLEDHQNHFLYLEGLWLNTSESLVHARATEDYEDYIALSFYATSVNAVMSPVNSETFDVRLTIDGQPITPEQAGVDVMFDDDNNSYVMVDESRMYNLINLSEFSGHDLVLSSNSPEFSLFAFTFGAYMDGEPNS